MKNLKKSQKIALGVVGALLVLVVVINLSFNQIIRTAVNTAGPLALGVPVTLEKVNFALLRGRAELKGLHIGNPEGFYTAGIFDLADITVRFDRASIFSDVVRINSIKIDGMVLTYEQGLLHSNVGTLLDKLTAEVSKSADDSNEAAAKKMLIDALNVADSKIQFALTETAKLTDGGSAHIPLPALTLTQIGHEKQGASFSEAFHHFLHNISTAATHVLVGAGHLAAEAGHAIAAGAVSAEHAVVDGAVHAEHAVVDGISHLFHHETPSAPPMPDEPSAPVESEPSDPAEQE